MASSVSKLPIPRRAGARIHLVAAVAAALAVGPSCASHPSATDLLAGRAPSRVQGVANGAGITDGRVPDEGTPWNGAASAIAQSPRAYVEFDLGRSRRIRALWLQGDHNDRYVIEAFVDGQSHAKTWVAEAVTAGGLRARYVRDLDLHARRLRVRVQGGDGFYAITELRAYEAVPDTWPPCIARVHPEAPNGPLRARMAWAIAACCGLVILAGTRLRSWALGIAAIPAIVLSVLALRECVVRFPLDVQSESAIRAGVAFVAAACAVVLVRSSARRRLACAAVLGLCAVAAFASFLHFGRSQFYDEGRLQPSVVHYFDMRVYFPVAKYFDELGFDGVYVASVAALEEMEARGAARGFDDAVLRDLRDHRVVRVRDVRDHVAEVRARFSVERWRRFVEDMRYFHRAMGRSLYLGSMLDHGGNATPLWLAGAHMLFRGERASHELFVATSWLDPALLLGGFLALAWSFGPVPATVCMLVFGANDYHMGGATNWAGATLRHDWMAALAFAFAALGRGRHFAGGMLIALAGFLRAFPAFAFLGIAATVAVWLVEEWRASGRFPDWRRLCAAQTPALRTIAGGAVGSLVLFATSVAVLGAGAWRGWLHKVGLLSAEPRVNHMGLQALVQYDFARDLRASSERGLVFDWVTAQAQAFAGRIVLYYVLAFLLTGLVVIACRGQPPVRAALLGLVLFVVWLYPANYYMHFVFVLPLLADAPRSFRESALSPAAAAIWVTLCLMCGAQYLSVIEPYLDRHYFLGSVCLMGAIVPCVVLASPDLRHFLRAASARAFSWARTRPA